MLEFKTIKKYLPIRIHHIKFAYGYWFGANFYFWCKGPVIVPMWHEFHNAVYAYSGNKIENGTINSWDDERSYENKLNRIRKRIRIKTYEFAHISAYKYIVERRNWYGCWEPISVTKTLEDAQHIQDEHIKHYMIHG